MLVCCLTRMTAKQVQRVSSLCSVPGCMRSLQLGKRNARTKHPRASTCSIVGPEYSLFAQIWKHTRASFFAPFMIRISAREPKSHWVKSGREQLHKVDELCYFFCLHGSRLQHVLPDFHFMFHGLFHVILCYWDIPTFLLE